MATLAAEMDLPHRTCLFPIMPTDFTRERLSEAAALRALREGVAGTSMAPWGDRLNAQEMTAAVHYVRSLYQEQIGDD